MKDMHVGGKGYQIYTNFKDPHRLQRNLRKLHYHPKYLSWASGLLNLLNLGSLAKPKQLLIYELSCASQFLGVVPNACLDFVFHTLLCLGLNGVGRNCCALQLTLYI